MFWDELKNWKGSIAVNDVEYPSVEDARNSLANSVDTIDSIILYANKKNATERKITVVESVPNTLYRITVKQYMTKKSSPAFDFMKTWNNDVPMPLRTMVGTVEKETKGMVYMHLYGDITSRVTTVCMKCGKTITNPVSQLFGMGPECGGHDYLNPLASEEELNRVIEGYRKHYLHKITWSGWIIKSAILEQEEVYGI
jgi:hypothetical protein